MQITGLFKISWRVFNVANRCSCCQHLAVCGRSRPHAGPRGHQQGMRADNHPDWDRGLGGAQSRHAENLHSERPPVSSRKANSKSPRNSGTSFAERNRSPSRERGVSFDKGERSPSRRRSVSFDKGKEVRVGRGVLAERRVPAGKRTGGHVEGQYFTM